MSQILPTNPAIGQAVSQALGGTGLGLSAKAQYIAEISRMNPTAFVFLIDQSGSMGNSLQFNGKAMTRAQAAAIVVNDTLMNMTMECIKAGEVRHYFDVAVIGYGQQPTAGFVWEGQLQGCQWVSSTKLDQNVAFKLTKPVLTGRGELRELPISAWFSPIHAGHTPMKSALQMATDLLREWIARHPGAYPPSVINITDGEATDATHDKLLDAALQLRNLHTTDGKVLLFNCHVSGAGGGSIAFPVQKQQLPDNHYAHLLFDMSSDLPVQYNRQIAEWRNEDLQTYTAMMFNAEMKDLFKLVDIGTRTALSQAAN